MVPRVLIADDHTVVREGLRALLEAAEIQIVGAVSDGHEAVRLAREAKPDVALLDISMPFLNGIEAAREIHRRVPQTHTLMLTMHTEDRYLLAALRSKTRGIVLKSQASEDLIEAIRAVVRGQFYVSPHLARTVIEAYLAGGNAPRDPLTSRERQILQLLAEGNSTKDSAQVLKLSVKTVQCHRANLMQKLNIHDSAGLVRYALRSGLTEL